MKNNFKYGLTLISLLFFIPKLNFGQAPPLGTTKVFAVFTAVGTVSNIGTPTGTEVWGNVGTNAGVLTAFPPGILHGVTHVADPTSASTAIDVSVLYSELFGRTCGNVLTGTLGGGITLGPGIYCKGDATTLNGELILDGGGNPNALFIFQIDGTFSTGASALISVTNSASLCNVFWQINGEFTLGPNDIFRGTVVANGAIHLLEGASLLGRALSTSGAIDMHNNPVINASPCNKLAVSFSSLIANRTNPTNVLLRWQTATEINNNGFEIERNMDNIGWELVKFIPSQAQGGNSSFPFTYIFNDMNSNKNITLYRIKQIDFNGRAKFSEIVAVRGNGQKGKIKVYPNPSSDGRLNIVFEDQNVVRDVIVSDITGRNIRQWKNVSNNTLLIKNMAPGIYTLRVVISENGNQSVERIIVSHY